jgi:hypothetical protein
MNVLRYSERELAVQTLADFECDGLGHHLDNADADVLRAMVRLCAERHRGAVKTLDEIKTLAENLRVGYGRSLERDVTNGLRRIEELAVKRGRSR